jgi:hypothetical protein
MRREMQYDPYFSSPTGGKEKLKQKPSNAEVESDDSETAEEGNSEK